MKALTRSIKDICEKNPPVWLSEDVLQEEKHDDFNFLAKQKKCEYTFYLSQWPEPKIEIRRLGGYSTCGKLTKLCVK